MSRNKGWGSVENEVSEVASRTGGSDLPSFPAHRNAAYNETPVKDPSGLAITALILGLCGLSVFGIGCGVRALTSIHRGGSNNRRRDKAFATAGIVFGVLWLGVTIAVYAHLAK
jgi:hypothetical protein